MLFPFKKESFCFVYPNLMALSTLQQPFPDRNHLYRMAICLYLRLVVAGNDVAVVARKGFQEFDESSHFSLVGSLVIQIIWYLDGQLERRNILKYTLQKYKNIINYTSK